MAVTGDVAKVQQFIDQLGGLKKATGKIGRAAQPKLAELIQQEFSTSTGPYGQQWQPKKDGGAPFAGSSADQRVKFRLLSDGREIRVSPKYPMHFHQDGTFGQGRKTVRKLRKRLRLEGYTGRALKQQVIAQTGSRIPRDPARPIIPTDEKGVPPKWEDAIVEAAVPVMAKAGASLKGK